MNTHAGQGEDFGRNSRQKSPAAFLGLKVMGAPPAFSGADDGATKRDAADHHSGPANHYEPAPATPGTTTAPGAAVITTSCYIADVIDAYEAKR